MKINRKNTQSVTRKSKTMTTGIGNNPSVFITPTPPLNVIEDQTVVVDKAETLAQTRAKGAAAARNVQRSILVGMMEAETLYVQGVADKSATPEQAVSTIEAAGLSVALVGDHTKPILAVTQGPLPGNVLLDANAKQLGADGRRKTFFNWQYTADGGKTFLNMPPTPKSNTQLSGLTPLSTYGFRVSVTNSDGVAGPWSQVVSFLVR